MWMSQYTQSLDGDSSLGQNFNYVATLPPVPACDNYMRLALRGPSSGQSRVQSMFVGHGSGYGFDSVPVPVTVNGAASFTLGSGITYSDPILSSSLGFDTSKPLNVAFGLLSGDAYRRNNATGGAHAIHYKTGSGDAGTAAKSGYSTLTGRTSLIEGIQFAAEVPAPIPEPIPQATHMEGYEQVLNGQRHSAGGIVEGVSGKYLHVQFRNPEGTGKNGFLQEVELCPTADTVMSLRSYNAALGSAFPKCNLMFAYGQASMEARHSHQDHILGNYHSIHFLKANQRNVIHLDVPLVGLYQGRGVVIVLHEPGVGAVANVQWREIAV